MKRLQAQKMVWAVAGSVVALGTGLGSGVAQAQAPGGPPAGGAPGGPGGPGRGGFVRGTVVNKDVTNNAIEVKMQDGRTQWVQIGKDVTIQKQVTIKVSDLKEKDVISVNGTPTGLVAEGVDVVPPAPAAGAAAGGAGAAPGGFPGGPGGPNTPSATARVTGTVVSLPDPNAQPAKLLTIEVDKVQITITTNEKTKLTRRDQVKIEDVAVNEQFTAMGQPEQRGDATILQARFAFIGEMNFGGRGGGVLGLGGGGRGGRGGRGGGQGGNN